jgi:hypothetical protein
VERAQRTGGPRAGEEEGTGNADSTAQAHDGGKAALADKRGRDALPVEHQTGAEGSDSGAVGPVRGAGVAQDAREVAAGG